MLLSLAPVSEAKPAATNVTAATLAARRATRRAEALIRLAAGLSDRDSEELARTKLGSADLALHRERGGEASVAGRAAGAQLAGALRTQGG
jgi:hypothetical protein